MSWILLHNLAAFCSLLPSLENVEVGPVNVAALGDHPRRGESEWVSPSVTRLDIKGIRRHSRESMDKVREHLAGWFPNSNFADLGAGTGI